MDSKNSIILHQSQFLMPTLSRAVRENNVEKRQEELFKVFRQVDTKKDELELFDACKSAIVVQIDKVKDKDGKEMVAKTIKESRNIAFLIRKHGRVEVTGMIRLLLANVNEYFNIKEGLTLIQIKEITEQIIEEFSTKLFIDELIYILKRAKTTSKLFNRLDGAIIFGWIDEYCKNRKQLIEKRHAQLKSSAHTEIDLDERFIAITDKMKERYISRETLSPEPTKTKRKKKND